MFVIYDFPFIWQTQNLFFLKKPKINLFLYSEAGLGI